MAKEHLLRHFLFHDDPFDTWTAEAERELLDNWFVEPPFIRALLGNTALKPDEFRPRSNLIFGRRGTGKTALRLRLETELSAKAPRAMVIRYLDLGPALRKGPKPSQSAHVEQILSVATMELIGFIALDRERYQQLQGAQRAELFGLVAHYYDALSPDVRSTYQTELSPIAGRLGIAGKQFGKTAVDLYNGVINVIKLEKVQQTSWALPSDADQDYPITRLQRFYSLANAAGVDSMWVMVDGVDEIEKVRSPQQIFDALSGILLSHRLLEFAQGGRETICFKCFLTHPQELKPLLKSEDFRFDRIDSYDIALTRGDINRAFVKRLSYFSNGKVTDFDSLCGPDAQSTHARLLNDCGDSPRMLFKMCNKILFAFDKSDQTESHLLDRASIDEGIQLAQAASTS